MINLLVPAEVVETAADGNSVTVRVRAVAGEDAIVTVGGSDIFPAPTTTARDSSAPGNPQGMGMWFEHRLLCPECDKGRKPLCNRAQQIAKDLRWKVEDGILR